jgi:beta-galactosidase/beta-glucuronidase
MFFVIMVINAICAGRYACAGDSIDLSGQWQFAMDRNDEGINGKWFEKEFDELIKLPGSMAEQGLGDELSVNTPFSSNIVDKSWYAHKRYEQYRQPGNIKLPWMLTPDKFYSGTAWYQRHVNVPQKWADKRIVLNLERTHWTAQVWVNGIKAGVGDSLNTPNVFDVTTMMKPGAENKISIRINNKNVNNGIFLGISSHTITDNSQGSWHGIVGDISLHATDKVWLDDVQIYPDVKNKRAKVKITIGNLSNVQAAGEIKIKAKCGWTKVSAKSVSFDKAGVIQIDYPMGDKVKLWDEFSPSLYTLSVELSGKGFQQSRQIKFGMRQLSRIGKQIAINGNAVHLRGTVDNAGFPLTGYPPTDRDSWRRIISVCKDYGMNHIRFHSWCPPEAAFAAADELGVYLQVEAGGNQLWCSWPKPDAFCEAMAITRR